MSLDFPALAYHLVRSHTERIALREVTLADAWPLFQATRDVCFNQFLLWRQPTEDMQVRERVQGIVDAAMKGQMAAVSAVVKDTGEWVSMFRFLPYRERANTMDTMDTMEMGIWTHHRFWHGRYSLELGRTCIDVAFMSCPDLQRLVGCSSPDNAPSCKLLEFCGMAPGEVEARPTEDGPPLMLREYAVTRQQWQATQAHRVKVSRFDGQQHGLSSIPGPSIDEPNRPSNDKWGEAEPQFA